MAYQMPSPMNRELARQFALDAEQTFQATLASNQTTYGRPGFVTSANYAAYDLAIKAAYTARTAEIATALNFMATGTP